MSIELAVPKKKSKPRADTTPVATVSIFDRFSTYPSHGLTPQRLTEIAKEADQGDIFRQSELFEEMLEKDARIFSLFQSRKLRVLTVEHEIVAASTDKADEEIAQFVRDVIDKSRNWRRNLEDMLDAVPKAFSALWIDWSVVPDANNTVVFTDLHWVHQKNFRFGKGSDPRMDLNEVRRLTDDNRVDGVELEPYKWVVPIIKARSGHPSRASIARTCTWPYLFKNFGLKSFVQFCELFGVPLRVGKYEQTAGDEDKKALWEALRGLSGDAAAMISKATEIEFPETSQKGSTTDLHDRFIALMNRELSQAVLGHTGAVESTPGTLGGEDAAQEVRYDLTESDALALDYAISDQLIRALVEFKYGVLKKYPYYKTKVEKPKDLLVTAQVDEKLVNMGWRMSTKYVTEVYGRPIAEEGETVLEPRQQQIVPFGSPTAKSFLGQREDLLK